METLELIKKYILNELSTSEMAEFEKKLTTDAQLREDVALQREIMAGVQRLALKKSAGTAYKKFKLLKALKLFTTAFIITAITATGLWYFGEESSKETSNIRHELNEKGEALWADADSLLPTQVFTIDPNKDTVIETKGGIIVAIPAGSWGYEGNFHIDGPIDVEIKEALSPEDILTSGLSTLSAEGPLETGGMFYIDGRKDGKPLDLYSWGLSISVPTDNYKAGMSLYDGVRQKDGTIAWEKPQKIESFLQPVDIHSLNFYPPLFLDSVAAFGKDATNKKYTDSLYYSFYIQESEEVTLEDEYKTKPTVSTIVGDDEEDEGYITTDKNEELDLQDPPEVTSMMPTKGIPPSSIKAIWNDQFQGTLIATKEFEQRLKFIHESCDKDLLEIYINNLDQRLSYIDSLAWKISSEPAKSQFKAFATQGLGRVKEGDKKSKMLAKYFKKKSAIHEKASRIAAEKYFKKHQRLDQKYEQRQSEFKSEEAAREQNNLTKEINLNYCDACKQLGYPNQCGKRRPSKNYYTTPITTTGWKNVDRLIQAVVASTTNRETLGYTDAKTGKKAVIKYEEASFEIMNSGSFDRVFAYLLPNQLNSFMRIKAKEKGKYTEKLNELIDYNFAAVGYLGEDIYYLQVDHLEAKNYDELILEKITKSQLRKKLNRNGNNKVIKAMKDDIKVQRYFIKNQQRQNEVNDVKELMFRLRPVVFPCRCVNPDYVDGDNHGEAPMSSIQRGRDLFSIRCASCHHIQLSKPNAAYPILAGVIDRVPGKTKGERLDWLREWIPNAPGMIAKDPYAKKLFRKYNGVVMTAFPDLTPQEIEDLIAFLDDKPTTKSTQKSIPCDCQCETLVTNVTTEVINNYVADSISSEVIAPSQQYSAHGTESAISKEITAHYPQLYITYKDVSPSYSYVGNKLCISGTFPVDLKYRIYEYTSSPDHLYFEVLNTNTSYPITKGKIDEPLVKEVYR